MTVDLQTSVKAYIHEHQDGEGYRNTFRGLDITGVSNRGRIFVNTSTSSNKELRFSGSMGTD